jgi:uncharacterized membrane protein YbhN (UPF0104 family)
VPRLRLSPPPPRALQIGLAVALLALVWRLADGPEAARRLGAAHPGWLAAALAALTLQTALSALRWRLTAGRFGIRMTRRAALSEYYLSLIVNQTFPGGVLGDAARAMRARAQAGLLASGQAVAFERLAGQIALLCVFAVAFLLTLAAPGGLEWPGWLLGPAIVLMLSALVLPAALALAARYVPGRAGRALAEALRAAHRALAAPEVRWRQIGLSVGTALCNVAAFAFCARAIGAGLSPSAALALTPLILFAMLIPLTVSGWGLREGSAATLFPLAGATAAEGLAASVAFGLVFLLSALPAIGLILRLRSSRAIKF